MFEKIGIIGLGLIGGSFARTIKKRGKDIFVAAFDTDKVSLDEAKNDGTIDGGQVYDCELIVVCTGAERVVEDINAAYAAAPNALITDVCSVKDFLPRVARQARYVGGHPMAGTEKSGYKNSSADLFTGKRYIITEETAAAREAGDRKKLTEFVRFLGAEPVEMTNAEHDEVLAAVSHLPHIAAYLLADAGLTTEQSFLLSGGGFKDTTRVALSDPEMWTEICMANRENIIRAVVELKDKTNKFLQALNAGDKKTVNEILKKGKEKRDKLC